MRLLDGKRYLPLFQWRMFRAERDHDALRMVILGFSISMEPARTRQGFYTREFNLLTAFATDAGFQKFIPPLVLAQGLAGAGD